MKIFLRVLLFVLSFQIEVRVRAEVLQSPKACLQAEAISCSVKSFEDKSFVKNSAVQMTLSQGAVLQVQDGIYSYIQGKVWLTSLQALRLQTLYFSVDTPVEAALWLEEKEGKIFLKNETLPLVVTLKDGREISVPPGFEFWVSGIASDGKNAYGVPGPMDLKEHVPLMAQYFKGTPEEFKVLISELKDSHGRAVQESSRMYRENSLRQIASVEQQKKQEKKALEARRKERQALKDYFFRRTFER